MPTEQADKIVEFLNGKPVMADELCVASGIRANSLSNLLNKTNLELCSPKPGRGRSRSFSLVDAFSIVLMDRLVKVVKDYEIIATALNDFNFEYHRQRMYAGKYNFRTDRELKNFIASSIYTTNEQYYERPIRNPYLFMVDMNGDYESTNDERHQRNWLTLRGVDGVAVVNMTYLFRDFDMRLARLRDFPVDEHYGQHRLANPRRVAAEAAASAFALSEEELEELGRKSQKPEGEPDA